MLQERRGAVRQIVNRPAKFKEGPVTPVRDCKIRDISDTGVGLVVAGGLASDHFTLFDTGGVERRCIVIWRIGEVVGARFEK
jgi:hypothetical protein